MSVEIVLMFPMPPGACHIRENRQIFRNHGTKEEDLNKIQTEMALTRVKTKMTTYWWVWPQLWKGPEFKTHWTMPGLIVYHPQLINNLEDFSIIGRDLHLREEIPCNLLDPENLPAVIKEALDFTIGNPQK
jgi:hypothetical protein